VQALSTGWYDADIKAALAAHRPGGRHRCDVALRTMSAAGLFRGAADLASLQRDQTLMICMSDGDAPENNFEWLVTRGFRPKKLPKSAWTREEHTLLVQACRELRSGTADRSEAIHDWSQWIATYTFASTKEAYEVRLELAKLAAMGRG
jgi:hypothetical protein